MTKEPMFEKNVYQDSSENFTPYIKNDFLKIQIRFLDVSRANVNKWRKLGNTTFFSLHWDNFKILAMTYTLLGTKSCVLQLRKIALLHVAVLTSRF